MAFATANVRKESAGSLNVLVGDWTGVVGDTAGTVTVGGARVYEAHFYDQSASTPVSVPFPVSMTVSGTLTTVTVNYSKTVNTGRFIIFYR